MSSWLREYFELLASPGHYLFELTLMLVIDVLLIGVGWRYVKRLIANRHSSDLRDTVEAEHELHGYDFEVMRHGLLELNERLDGHLLDHLTRYSEELGLYGEAQEEVEDREVDG